MKTFRLRTAMATAAAFLVLASTPGSATVSQAEAIRLSAGTYELRWQREVEGKPVSVFVASQPDAGPPDLKLVSQGNNGAQTVINYTGKDRPYFYVTDGDGKGVWTAERVLPLEGGKNFRDLGGYKTASGQTVKWGRVFRSGTMSQLTEADYTYLNRLGIKVVCDFRTTDERQSEPNTWAKTQDIPYWTRDYSMSLGDWGQLLSSRDLSADTMKAAITEGYRQLPYEQAAAYREMFLRLAAGEIPLAFNCSAGKDRAGTAAALLLSALGVPRETIVKDYALSDKIANFGAEMSRHRDENGLFAAFAKVPPEVLAPLMASDSDYIRQMFATIEQKHGSVENYFAEVLQLTDEQLAAIRAQLLD